MVPIDDSDIASVKSQSKEIERLFDFLKQVCSQDYLSNAPTILPVIVTTPKGKSKTNTTKKADDLGTVRNKLAEHLLIKHQELLALEKKASGSRKSSAYSDSNGGTETGGGG